MALIRPLRLFACSNWRETASAKWINRYIILFLSLFQDPNEDTQWNDILRSKGIIPPKEAEVTEADIVNMIESTIQEKSRSVFYS